MKDRLTHWANNPVGSPKDIMSVFRISYTTLKGEMNEQQGLR